MNSSTLSNSIVPKQIAEFAYPVIIFANTQYGFNWV